MITEILLDTPSLETRRIAEADVRRAYKPAAHLFARAVFSSLSLGLALYTTHAKTEVSEKNEFLEPQTSGIYGTCLTAWSHLEDAGFRELLSDLAGLFRDSEDYNEDFLRPSESALSTAWRMLTDTRAQLDQPFPPGTVYADGNGGLRIEWIRPSRELRLIVRSGEADPHYIYHEFGDLYGTDYVLSAGNLAYWLRWLDEDDHQG
jgi:hypothetical protein